MRERLGMHRFSLTVQMVFSFVLLVLFTGRCRWSPGCHLDSPTN